MAFCDGDHDNDDGAADDDDDDKQTNKPIRRWVKILFWNTRNNIIASEVVLMIILMAMKNDKFFLNISGGEDFQYCQNRDVTFIVMAFWYFLFLNQVGQLAAWVKPKHV